MTSAKMDKARLAAFVDGGLDPEEAAAVVMHLADHPEDQAYVEELMALNEMLAAAYESPLNEPAPQPIVDAIMGEGRGAPAKGGEIIAFRRFAAGGISRSLWFSGGAIAASVAAFLIVSDFGETNSAFLTPGPLAGKSAVGEALNELASGDARFVGDDVELSIRSSFETASKGVCREFDVIREDGARLDAAIACPDPRAESGWRVEVATTIETKAPADAITPASGAIDDPIGAFLDETGAGAALSPSEEARARASGWRAVGSTSQ